MALIEGGKSMGVTEIQGELRKIQTQLSELELQLEDMKPKANEEGQEKYKKINIIAEKHQIKNKALLSAKEDVRINYVLCLGFLTMSNKNHIYDKLLFLMRIAAGIDAYHDSEQLYQDIILFNKNDWDNSLKFLEKYRYPLITDALILKTLKNNAKEEKLSSIVEVAEIFGLSKEELTVCAMVAKAVVTDDFDILDDVSIQMENKWNSKFLHYIPEKWLIKGRKECVFKDSSFTGRYRFLESGEYVFDKSKSGEYVFDRSNSKRIANGSVVREGQSLIWKKDDAKSAVRAKKDGVVYFIDAGKEKDDYSPIKTYVVSYFDDYDLFCKWYGTQK